MEKKADSTVVFEEYHSPVYIHTHRLVSNGNGKSPFLIGDTSSNGWRSNCYLCLLGCFLYGKCSSTYSLKNQYSPGSLTTSLPLKKGFRLEDLHRVFCQWTS